MTIVKNELKLVDKSFYKKLVVIILLLAFIFLPVYYPHDEGSWLNTDGAIGKIVYMVCILLTALVCGLAWFLVIIRRYERNVYESVLREINLEQQHGFTSFRRKWTSLDIRASYNDFCRSWRLYCPLVPRIRPWAMKQKKSLKHIFVTYENKA